MEKQKRVRKKIGELTIQMPHCIYSKPVWAYFEKNYWTDNKLMCVLNINFKKEEFEKLQMFMEMLYNLKIKGVQVSVKDVNMGLYNKGTKETFYKRYFKIFFNVNLSKTTIGKVLKELNDTILVSVSRYIIEVNEDNIEPLKEKTMVELI